jgi:hypothetical protein
MNIRLIVYRIAQIIQMTDKISKNEIEIVWALTSFLNDECRDFLMMKIDEYRDFVVFVKFLMKKFLEFLIKMKMIVWENFLLLMTREINASLMIVEVIVLSMIDLEMMILEI